MERPIPQLILGIPKAIIAVLWLALSFAFLASYHVLAATFRSSFVPLVALGSLALAAVAWLHL